MKTGNDQLAIGDDHLLIGDPGIRKVIITSFIGDYHLLLCSIQHIYTNYTECLVV